MLRKIHFVTIMGLIGLMAPLYVFADLKVPGPITIQLENRTEHNLVITNLFNINDCAKWNFDQPVAWPAKTKLTFQGNLAECPQSDILYEIAFKVRHAAKTNAPVSGNFAFICSAQASKCSVSQSEFPIRLPDGTHMGFTDTSDGDPANPFVFKFTAD